MTLETPTRPLVRYHGGKWILAPWIIEHFPAHRCYVEPFGGGGSVLLRKPRSYAEVYNDLDGEMVNLFRVVRDNGEDLRRLLELTPFSRVDFRESYEASGDALEQARRTVVRSFMGFGSNSHNKNTGFRSNSNRSGTTPAHDWRNYPGALGAIIDRLRGVVIENRDAVEVMRAHDAETTLHYVDPPYVAATRDKGGDYRHEMTDEQHRALAAALSELKGAVIVSGYPSPLYDELFAEWQRVERRALADGAAERTEVLWMHNCDYGLFGQNTKVSHAHPKTSNDGA
jgi:DNA adenine methylase